MPIEINDDEAYEDNGNILGIKYTDEDKSILYDFENSIFLNNDLWYSFSLGKYRVSIKV